MESTERLVRTWMGSGRDEEIAQMASDITAGKSTLLNLVKVSGEYLTSEENQLRSKGIELLSLVLEKLPASSLTRPITRTLVNFYCDKLDDSDTIIPALQGLQRLASLPTFGGVEAGTTVEGIIRHVRTKALTQTHRFRVYSIIDLLIANHREVLKSMGLKFLDGYIALVDGEKDPRNLLVVFAMNRVILVEFDISQRIQTMYDIIFCYFPISFRPPPNNPGGITADDLRGALRKCVAGTPMFGSIAIPHFLDNLVSGGRIAKRDTLETLTFSLPVYGPAVAREFSKKLWNALKLEVFQPVDRPTEQQALVTLQTLVKTIYGNEDAIQDSVQGLARDACAECLGALREPEKREARPAMRVLCAFVVGTTPSIARYTIAQAVPHLITLFTNPDEATSRAATLILLAELIEAARDSPCQCLLLGPHKDEILGALSSALNVSSLRLPALTGLKGLVTTAALLTPEELGFVVHNVTELLRYSGEANDGDDDEGPLELLAVLAKEDLAPQQVVEQTLPVLFAALPETAPPRAAVEDRAQAWRALKALQTLCIAPTLFTTMADRLVMLLETLCRNQAGEDAEPTVAYAHAVLKTLLNTLIVKVGRGDRDVQTHSESVVAALFGIFVSTPGLDTWLVQAAADVVTLFVRALPAPQQETYLQSLFSAFTSGDVSKICKAGASAPAVKPFDGGAATGVKDLVVLFAGAVAPMRKEINLSIPSLSQFLRDTFFWTIQAAESDVQRASGMHIIAVLVNRKAEDSAEFLQVLQDKIWDEEIASKDKPTPSRRRALETWAWISKALLLQSHSLAQAFSERFFTLFADSDKEVAWEAAKAVGFVPAPDDVLTRANHAVIRILYAQKYVNRVLPLTIAGAKSTEDAAGRLVYLVELSSLIKSAPKATYAAELPTLMPLLIRGLDLPDPAIRNNVIETFLAAAEGDDKDKGGAEKALVNEHAATLIHAMLRNCRAAEMPLPKVRISALRYLGRLPRIVRADTLNRYKGEVLKELGKVLDDPRRSVRKEAVDARTHWFKYNG